MALLDSLKQILKPLVPAPLLRRRYEAITREREARFAGKTLGETFSEIYAQGLWGASDNADFYSGTGSHDEAIVGPYVAAVRSWVRELPPGLDAVDLGCGDFNVGRQLRDLFARYTACDVVPKLIERNRERYRDLDVEFRLLDISADPLPPGRIVFLRQVLQHLSNAQVAAVLAKLNAYDFAIITEHLPTTPGFRPNLDKPAGAGIRLSLDSGIVPTEPPFSLKARSQRVLCEVPEGAGLIRTTAYVLR